MIFELSYIVATRNRLPFLKITLENLLADLQPDEEVVVVDGNSTDGTTEYLQQLFESGKIHQLVSEADKNQAHAWNKALLMAKGTIIKKIIDDDVFCFEAIRECKNYMLANPQVDVIISNDLNSDINDSRQIQKSSRLPQFEKWKKGSVPSFTFGDVHMLIRRTSLAYIGLYNTGFTMMDWEYSLRISYLKANIVYYTGYNALSVFHPQTVSAQKDVKLLAEEGKRAGALYSYKGDRAEISFWSKAKIGAGKILFAKKSSAHISSGSYSEESLGMIFGDYYKRISELNNSESSEFIQNQ